MAPTLMNALGRDIFHMQEYKPNQIFQKVLHLADEWYKSLCDPLVLTALNS